MNALGKITFTSTLLSDASKIRYSMIAACLQTCIVKCPSRTMHSKNCSWARLCFPMFLEGGNTLIYLFTCTYGKTRVKGHLESGAKYETNLSMKDTLALLRPKHSPSYILTSEEGEISLEKEEIPGPIVSIIHCIIAASEYTGVNLC